MAREQADLIVTAVWARDGLASALFRRQLSNSFTLLIGDTFTLQFGSGHVFDLRILARNKLAFTGCFEDGSSFEDIYRICHLKRNGGILWSDRNGPCIFIACYIPGNTMPAEVPPVLWSADPGPSASVFDPDCIPDDTACTLDEWNTKVDRILKEIEENQECLDAPHR